jgi:REP element-mobilizing transposase RayT
MPWRVPQNIPLPRDFVGFEPRSQIQPTGFSSYERHLPHWRLEGACYFITFRLNDSIPQEIEHAMKLEKEVWLARLAHAAARHEGKLPPDEASAWEEFQRSRLKKLEQLLDEGHGESILCETTHRQTVVRALQHFEGIRYEMLAYVVMPNHVHLVCRPLPGHQLEDICHSWKWFTGQEIQRRRGQVGQLSQQENFDRIIRDANNYANCVRYIARNPIKATLSESEASAWFCSAIENANVG